MNILDAMAVIVDKFHKEGVDFALIGGLALHAYGVVRATSDIDLLILIQDKEKVRAVMKNSGYEIYFESDEIMTFLDKEAKTFRVDFLLAHRRYSRGMLKRAERKNVLFNVPIKVARPEDLIGLKVQASANDPKRKDQDMADIRSLIRNEGARLDWALVQEYFSLFDEEGTLDRLRKEEGFASHS